VMKQSHENQELKAIRLLRSARNDSFLYFLREHQLWDLTFFSTPDPSPWPEW